VGLLQHFVHGFHKKKVKLKVMDSGKVVTPVKTGVQRIHNCLRTLDSGACPGPDPEFAGMTGNRIFRLFTKSSEVKVKVKKLSATRSWATAGRPYDPLIFFLPPTPNPLHPFLNDSKAS
jgi:hypothetical protein